MLDLSIDAFRQAVDRVTAAPATVARTMFGPLTEAAWWVECVDEEFEHEPGYKSRRNTDPQGIVVSALRYARSALGHHRAFVVERGGGLTIPFTVPFIIESYPVWVPVDALPVFPQQATVRPLYEKYVGGRRVLDTFSDADAWFERARSGRRS